MTKMTQKQLRDAIDANNNFRPGVTFSDSVIAQMFDISVPSFITGNTPTAHHSNIANASKYQLQKLSAVRKLNDVLAARGMYIKQHNYTDYKVVPRGFIAGTTTMKPTSTVNTMERVSINKIARATTLQEGCKRHGSTYARITDRELAEMKKLSRVTKKQARKFRKAILEGRTSYLHAIP